MLGYIPETEQDNQDKKMKQIDIGNGVTVFFQEADQDVAEVISQAFKDVVPFILDYWGLNIRFRCKFYVISSMMGFIFHSASWPRRILLALTLPLWLPKTQKIWKYSGGWNLRSKYYMICGVRSPRLFHTADTRLGKEIFIETKDPIIKFQYLAVHELVHALTNHLMLPLWLNEGMAQHTVDRFFQVETMRRETLEKLNPTSAGDNLPGMEYRQLARTGDTEIIKNFSRGYWLTRYLEEVYPGKLKELFAAATAKDFFSPVVLEEKIAQILRFSERKEFWQKIDSQILAHFSPSL